MTLVGQRVTVELKNDMEIEGKLDSVDQFLNIKLSDINVVDEEKYPHLLAVKNTFVRGSVIRYVQVPAQLVDTELLQDAARREYAHSTQKKSLTADSVSVAKDEQEGEGDDDVE